MDQHILTDHEHRVIHLDALTELKQKLYTIHQIDKFDSMNEIFNNLRQHDKDLADTLTLIISDFNTSLHLHQNHFVIILDKIITLEEKRLVRDMSRPHNSRSEDKMRESCATGSAPAITINNVSSSDKEDTKFNWNEFSKEYKWFIIAIVLLISVIFAPTLTHRAIEEAIIIKKELISDPSDTSDSKDNEKNKKERENK